jgi:hypothetical protein
VILGDVSSGWKETPPRQPAAGSAVSGGDYCTLNEPTLVKHAVLPEDKSLHAMPRSSARATQLYRLMINQQGPAVNRFSFCWSFSPCKLAGSPRRRVILSEVAGTTDWPALWPLKAAPVAEMSWNRFP